MRGTPMFLLLATLIAALFAYSGAFTAYPVYYSPVAVAPYQFAGFLFWTFLLLFFMAVIFNATNPRRTLTRMAQKQQNNELKAREDTIVSGFTLALFLLVVAAISGLFGFGVIASAVAGLAMIIFWIAIAVGIVAMIMGFYDHRGHLR